ncbi:MAG TPA: S8 family serine peptidase [Pyrinomonadaceae bacterium]|nr:S8 family serine peptidase [Pyrinomonadaceae bacterium]
MSELIVSTEIPVTADQLQHSCALCARPTPELIQLVDLDAALAKLALNAIAPGQLPVGVCSRCVDILKRAKLLIETYPEAFSETRFALPTWVRMDADEGFTGKGVTMAFLDSGFYAHDDLVKPENRIVAYHSIFDREDDRTSLETTDAASWHGMMTSVVAAGNGQLSDGFYRGIAPDSNLVLVKIGRTGRISEEQIQTGLKWVLKNREKYNIRIVNISAGGDSEKSYLDSSLCQTVEQAVKAGLVVVCAVGNAGASPGHPVLPPASSPSSISVGGLDDQNSLDRAKRGMYRSSYGPTFDGLQKPEIIAPGIWVAGPILPSTPTADQAELCSKLDAAEDQELSAIIEANEGVDKDFDQSRDLPVPLLRQLITIKVREANVINQHYKYIDGTSFAAPIVSSIVACMLEANPALSPQVVKRILMDTAERVTGVEVERQGWGVVTPRRAVELALKLVPR